MRLFFLILSFFIFTACSVNSPHKTYTPKQDLLSKLNLVKKQWSKTPYRLGGTKVSGADCSGFTQSVFYSLGAKIPRTTKAQLSSGTSISRSNLRTGDLLFFRTGRGPSGLHVGIYTRNGKFIHLSTRGGVKEVSLNTKYWGSKYLGARRYLR